MFDFDPVYLIYRSCRVSAALSVEGAYLLFFTASYRNNINRRLQVMSDSPDRESVLIQLRRERGLTAGGEYRLPMVALNRLLLQSGLTMGVTRLVIFVAFGMAGTFADRDVHGNDHARRSWPRWFAAWCCRC